MGNISFSIQSGGLGRPLAGEDHISSIVTYMANGDLPGGFSTTDRIKTIYSIQNAETLGIVPTSIKPEIKILHYTLNQLFVQNKKAVVYVGIFDQSTKDYSEIETVQLFADGKIRQFGVVDTNETYDVDVVTALNTSCANLFNTDQPGVVVYGCDTSSVSDLSTLADLRALDLKYVSMVIGQDGDKFGNDLFFDLEVSIPAVGSVIGAISFAKVNECIGWIEKFNFDKTGELAVPAFGNGVLAKTKTDTELNAIDAKGYLFFIKHKGISGTYAKDSHTATPLTSDFAYIENNRTMLKAVRGIRTFVLPDLNSPLFIQADGNMTETTVSHFKNNSSRALEQMVVNGEISAFEVSIDPTQNVLSTSNLNIGVSIVPVGVARQINFNIGFVTKL